MRKTDQNHAMIIGKGKKIVLITFAFLLTILAYSANGEIFYAETAYEARMKALPVFEVCALSMEYPDDKTQQGHIYRWKKSIYLYVGGTPTDEDMHTLKSFLMELALRVPGLPNITLTDDPSKANIMVYYVLLDEMQTYLPGYVQGNLGYFHYSSSTWEIVKAQVGISTDRTDQWTRNHLIKEELVGALGLLNDHNMYEDSIVYQRWTIVQELSELDWIMLNMLYSPLIKPGDNLKTVEKVFTQAWND